MYNIKYRKYGTALSILTIEYILLEEGNEREETKKIKRQREVEVEVTNCNVRIY